MLDGGGQALVKKLGRLPDREIDQIFATWKGGNWKSPRKNPGANSKLNHRFAEQTAILFNN